MVGHYNTSKLKILQEWRDGKRLFIVYKNKHKLHQTPVTLSIKNSPYQGKRFVLTISGQDRNGNIKIAQTIPEGKDIISALQVGDDARIIAWVCCQMSVELLAML